MRGCAIDVVADPERVDGLQNRTAGRL